MGWLSSGGTAFSYRMSIPVANPDSSGNRHITVPFPAWYLLSLGKIAQSSYQDVHVTKADGTTELPCVVTASRTGLAIDYSSMPQGCTTLYVYYGHASVSAATAPTLYPETGGTLLDYGAEQGALAGTVANPPWVPDATYTPTTYAYNHDYPRGGEGQYRDSWMEMKFVAPSSNYGGIYETATSGFSADGSEIRFWARFDATSKRYQARDRNSAAARGFNFWWENDGTIKVVTDQTKTGYTTGGATTVGSYNAGEWRQYRVVLNFTGKSYTLSYRVDVADAWTQLKASGAADYNIPMQATSPSSHLGTTFFGYDVATWWLDDYQYATGGITDGAIGTALLRVLAIEANDERTSEEAAAGTWYLWGRNLSMTYLDSANATTYYGSGLNHRVGYTSGGTKYHGLLKFFEGALPTGTVSAAALHLYLESNSGIAASTSLKAHRFLNYSTGTNTHEVVKTGWDLQTGKSLPTWNVRYYDYTQAANQNWQTAGAVGANEVNLSDGDAPSLALAVSEAVGYKSFTLPTAWMADWLGDGYSQGVLLKEAAETGSDNQYAVFSAPGRVNSPVLVVTYTAYESNQWTGRKLSTNGASLASGMTQTRHVVIPSTNTFGVVGWTNGTLGIHIALVTPEGRISLYVSDTYPSGRLNDDTGGVNYGIRYDPQEHRYWLGGSADDILQHLTLGYAAEAYLPRRFTWNTSSHDSTKSAFFPYNGVVHCLNCATDLYYCTFTRSTATWSAQTTLVAGAPDHTNRRNIATDHAIGVGDTMAGSGEIWLSGTLEAYPAFGLVKVDSEAFWYTGKDEVNNKLTGVTRASFGTSAADHTVGTAVSIDRSMLTFAAVEPDAVRSCLHVTYVVNAATGSSNNYPYGGYLRHYYADAVGTWKDEADSALSLPVTQVTERICTPTGKLAYLNELLVTSSGHVLVGSAVSTAYATPSYGYAWLTREAYGASAFSDIDLNLDTTVYEIGISDLGSGILKLTGLHGNDTRYVGSIDGGATWDGTTVVLSTHTFTNQYLWANSASREVLGDVGLAVAQHAGAFGAIYLQSSYPPPTDFDRVIPIYHGLIPVLDIDRVVPVHFIGYPAFDRVVPVQFRTQRAVDLVIPVEFDVSSILRVDRVVPIHHGLHLRADRRIPIAYIRALPTNFDRAIPVLLRRLTNFDRTIPLYLIQRALWDREIDAETLAYVAEIAAEAENWSTAASPSSEWEREIDA